MATANSIMKHHDKRTGKSYALQTSFEVSPQVAMTKMIEMAERDYQATLPPEKRAVANQPTDFTCPRCKTHEQPARRKQAMVSGGFFFFIGSISTYLTDVWKCLKCDYEFVSQELLAARQEVEKSNWSAECMERYKDGEITDKVVISTLKAIHY